MRSTIFWAAIGGFHLAGMLNSVSRGDAAWSAFSAMFAAVSLIYAAPYWYRRSTGGKDA